MQTNKRTIVEMISVHVKVIWLDQGQMSSQSHDIGISKEFGRIK